ncbi:MAG TPA: pitrilysin family protein [Pyrinomonadaceae bacterium]|nr:pitrilysin family protein [Pyrinomonadaceae bacterium]
MRKILFTFFAGLAVCLTVGAQVKVAPLDIKERTLANGLKVVTLQDNSSPTVAIHVWYNVGSKNDPPSRNGFAHLFEHIMFKSTKNMKSEMMDRLTEDVGGYNNASTWDDFTNYYEVIPSNYLETLIWAEAERMSNLTVDETNFQSERAVVEEEFRQSVLAQPYGMFNEYVQQLSYTTHPYKRTTIGTLADLDSATLADVQKFHSTYYRPDNATLIVVGDFDQAQLDGWIDKYFGRIAKPTATIPRVTEVEPARSHESRFAKTAPNVPFPAVAISYLGPKSDDPDVPALRVAEKILSGGESSRLYQSLVYKQNIAQEANFGLDDRVEGGTLEFTAIASQDGTPEKLEAALLAELKKIQTDGVTAKELEKAKNQLITDIVRSRQNSDGKAVAIERAVTYQHDPKAVNSDIPKLQAVTAADVQRVMKKYFSDNNRIVIYYTNATDKTAPASTAKTGGAE